MFDAVSAKRCYRDAMPLEECFKIIADGSGRDFDPTVARIFFGYERERYRNLPFGSGAEGDRRKCSDCRIIRS